MIEGAGRGSLPAPFFEQRTVAVWRSKQRTLCKAIPAVLRLERLERSGGVDAKARMDWVVELA